VTRYVWRDGRFRDTVTGEPMEVPERDGFARPFVRSDIPAYKSPLGTGVIDGRAARREDLKRNNCREVDPSEHKVEYWGRHDGRSKRDNQEI
jgi:hypothetical protein